jgi:hypothetical protein
MCYSNGVSFIKSTMSKHIIPKLFYPPPHELQKKCDNLTDLFSKYLPYFPFRNCVQSNGIRGRIPLKYNFKIVVCSYIYIHIHIYIHTYIHTYTYMYVYVYMYMYIYICIYICIGQGYSPRCVVNYIQRAGREANGTQASTV